jgi:ABC-2 type transport system ATP-binding protein
MADGSAGSPSAETAPLALLEGISKCYGRKRALADLSLRLRPTDICGFVGANGGGKTTALRILAGILRPDAGRGTVLGFDVRREAAEIRAHVGYLSQRLSLYSELSVLENLRFRARIYGLTNPRRMAEAAIEEFDLTPWTHAPAGSLSGGWARRLQFAASLLHAPRLVLLDEPTSGLDSTVRHDVWRRVERLAAQGAGVVVCTHDLVEAERCTHTVLFAEGDVVAAGTPDEIAKRMQAVAFRLSGIGSRRLGNEVRAVSGVLASYPDGDGLRVIADPGGEDDLRRFATARGASVTSVEARLEDVVLAPPMPTPTQRG